MADAAHPPAGSDAALSSTEGLRAAWDEFRAGGVVLCPCDGAPVALSVDASAGAYRFVCVRCGTSSAWFESDAAGLRVRG